MKIAKFLSLFALVVLTASLASAQITVDSNDDSCWQNISSLRACQAAQQRLAELQAQQCTSFPEYQCAPEEQPATAPAKMQGLKSKEEAVTPGATAVWIQAPSAIGVESGATLQSRSGVGQNNSR